MKKLLYILLFLIIWLSVLFILIQIYPIHLMTISLIMVYILILVIILPCFSFLWNKKEITNFKKAKKKLENCDKLSEKEYLKFIHKILYTIDYTDLKKYEKNNYYIDYVAGNTLFNIKKRKNSVEINIINRIAQSKIFEDKSIIIISNAGFTKEALNNDKGVILWDKTRLFEILEKCDKKNLSRKNTIYNTIEDLDFMDYEEFKNSIFDLLKENYNCENNLFIIDKKSYSVECIKSSFQHKITKDELENSVKNIYASGTKNPLIITNGYYEDNVSEICEKLQIVVWNRDNLSLLFKEKNKRII